MTTHSSQHFDSPPQENILARTAITLEYASLRNAGHCPLGMYVVPSSSDLFKWDAVFFVHQGRLFL